MGYVGICVPTILMARGIIGKRPTYFYVAFWVAFAIAAALVFSAVV